MRDVIRPGAFSNTIEAWRQSGKNVPLHWDHKGDPDKIIGSIEPSTMVQRADGLYVEGKLDLESSAMAREAWRAVKAGAVGLSFGFLPKHAKKRIDGGRDLHEVDVFEISITPSPMHPGTRVLSTKRLSALAERVDEHVDSARRRVQQLMNADQDERAAQLGCELAYLLPEGHDG